MMLILVAALLLSSQAVEEIFFPEVLKVIPSSLQRVQRNGVTTIIDGHCDTVPVVRNTRDFQVRSCERNSSILTDGSIGEFNFTNGLQIAELQATYAWNNQRTPENPFILYNFESPVTIARIIVTFILSQIPGSKVPVITMFVSNTNSNYPRRRITVNYNSSNAPDTGVYQLELIPVVSGAFQYWCVDMEPPDGTDWVIVSEITVYQEINQTGITITPTSTQSATSDTATVSSRLAAIDTTSYVTTASSSHRMRATAISSLPSTTLSPSSTPSTLEGTLSQNLFQFIYPQDNPVVYKITPGVKESVKLNCTAFYNGSNDDITITWTSNEWLIYNDTQSYIENYRVSTTLKVAGKSQAMFTCTFQHLSGWNNSRDFIFDANDSSGSKEKEFPIVIVIAAAGGVLLFVFIVTLIWLIVCCRQRRHKSVKKKKMMNMRPSESNVYLARERTNSLYEAPNLTSEDVYYDKVPFNIEKMKTFMANRTGARDHINSIYDGLIPMPEAVYYDKILYSADNTSEKFLDIYEVHETNRNSNRVSRNSTGDNCYENIYLEPIHPEELMTASEKIYSNEEDKNSTLLPYTSMYDNPAPLNRREAPAIVSWDNIIPCKELGNGQFGEVILALTANLSLKDLKLSSKDDDKSNQTLVAIKTLKENDNDDVQKAFEKEIKFMARLDHANVIKVLGICPTGVPFLMMEYMENGDLNSFLKKFKYSEDLLHSNEVDLAILMYIAMQIVYGMKYLASRKFVHRDLAARNCLVGRNFVVKVADFGMAQNLYSSHYFVLKGAAILPIRWMATESFYGKFSLKTDVWSYGVTLWEIFTLCKVTPYNELNDQQLIIDIMLGPKRNLLPKPDICPDKVYKIMLSCFEHDSKQRANFNELYDKLYKVYIKFNNT